MSNPILFFKHDQIIIWKSYSRKFISVKPNELIEGFRLLLSCKNYMNYLSFFSVFLNRQNILCLWLVHWYNIYMFSESNTCIASLMLALPFLISGNSQIFLILSWRRSLSYRNQFIDFQSELVDLFLYDRDLRHERVNWSFSYW